MIDVNFLDRKEDNLVFPSERRKKKKIIISFILGDSMLFTDIATLS